MRPRIRLLLFAVIAVSTAVAQSADPPHDGALRGSVVDAVTRHAIARALVALDTAPRRSVLTDANGKFFIDGLKPGEVHVRVRRPGYLDRADRNAALPPQKVEVASGETQVVFELVPQGVITGRVLDQDGEPVENALVQVWYFDIAGGRRMLRQRAARGTNPDGSYRVADLTPGSYYIVAQTRPDEATAVLEHKDSGYPVTYFYPGAQNWPDAAPVTVSAGQIVVADLRMPTVPLVVVSGIVAGPAGMKGGAVSVMPEAPFASERSASVAIEPDGTFKLQGLSSGHYVVSAQTSIEGNQPLVTSMPLVIGAKPVTGLRLTVEPLASIPIVVHAEATHPRPATAAGNPNAWNYPVQLQLAGERLEMDRYISPNRERTGFAFEAVLPGRYRLDPYQRESWYVAAARQQGVDLFQHPLSVVSSGEQAAVEVELRDDGGAIAGDVRGDIRCDLCSVVAVPEFAPMQSPRIQMLIDSGPQFRMPNLAPGSYRVYAVDRPEAIDWMQPEAVRHLASQEVNVTANANAAVHLKLVHTGE